jgi:hypothetical protein
MALALLALTVVISARRFVRQAGKSRLEQGVLQALISKLSDRVMAQ